MLSVTVSGFKRALLALAIGAAITWVLWMFHNIAFHSLWGVVAGFLFLIPAVVFTAIVGGSGSSIYSLATAINLIIYSVGTYVILWSLQKGYSHPRTQKRSGLIDEILFQERTPAFTTASVLASVLMSCFMFVTYARWHGRLGFGALAVLPFYATLGFISVAINVVFGCVATARGESYAGRVAVASASICVCAAGACALLMR